MLRRKKKDKDAPPEIEAAAAKAAAASAPAESGPPRDDGFFSGERQEPEFLEPPEADLSPSDDTFLAVRMKTLREYLTRTDLERRMARCTDTLLSAAELPVNPFPTLARLLRHEELALALQLEASSSSGKGASHRHLWRETDLHMAQSDHQLALVPRIGAVWRSIAPLLDGDALRYVAAGLAGSHVLTGAARSVNTPQGNFTIKSVCALSGAHVYGGRMIPYARTIEVREHVQVRGPASRLDAALAAFAEHICATAVALHGSKEHFVYDLEVYTGDSDAFDDEASAEVEDGRATSNARGTPERFGLVEMHSRAPALSRSLQAAAVGQLPVCLAEV